MIRVIMKSVTMHVIWLIMGLALLPAVLSAELKAIDDLTVSDSTFHSVSLTWTSPGIADSYDVRYSTSILNNNDGWDLACQILGEPAPGEPGTSQSMTFSGLSPNTTYYFAIKCCDADTNCSAFSNMASTTTDNDDFIRYIIYENGEDGTIKKWSKPVWPPEVTVANIYDEKRQGHVIALQGVGTRSKYRLHLEDGNMWNINTSQFKNIVVKWSLQYTEDFFIYFNIESDCNVENMVYLTLDSFVRYLEEYWDNQWDLDLLNRLIIEKPAYCKRGLYIYHFLDPEVIDGQWHNFVRDLQADLQNEKPLGKILKVNGFVISGSGRVDDIMFGKAVNTGDDSSPPVPPMNLAAEVISSSDINLSWDVSTDDVGVAEYRIYRDGLEIGMSPITTYADKGLFPLTTYTYNVAAYDYAGNLSNNSMSVSEKTLEASPEAKEEQEEEQGQEQGSREIQCFIITAVFGE